MSERPTKRQRASSDASNSTDDQSTTTTTTEAQDSANMSHPTPHDKLWYEDGNVVLATDVYLYRVHKSILSRESSMFRDMFRICDDAEDKNTSKDTVVSVAEQYEGIPLVRMIDDANRDVSVFLSAIYDRNFFRLHKTTDLLTLMSLSRMSTKYDAPEIRLELIGYLFQTYPDTLALHDKSRKKRVVLDPQEDDVFLLLALARQCDARVLLPALFYACATQPFPLILSPSKIVGEEDLSLILQGREAIMKRSYEVAILALSQEDHCRYPCCNEMRRNSLVHHLDFSNCKPPPFPLHVSPEGILPSDFDDRAVICMTCAQDYRKALKAHRRRFWEELPTLFSLGTWDEIRRQSQRTL